MEKKINIAELLKDCPNGMELDCAMCDNVTFVRILDGDSYPIQIQTPEGHIWLSEYGCVSLSTHAKCVIFPKGETTWEGFKRPFKDGDIVATNEGSWIGIVVGGYENELIQTYCVIKDNAEFEAYFNTKIIWAFDRLATEEEKQKLFNAIKENGYKWNAETKTLEKLIEQKFDITTLKPFDKVLVRDANEREWIISFFSHCNGLELYKYSCINGAGYAQCIPYEGNEHLLGKTDDCDEFYKTWG